MISTHTLRDIHNAMNEKRYFVTYIMKNKTTGKTSYTNNPSSDNIGCALKRFHEILAEYIATNDVFSIAVVLHDSEGNVIRSEYWEWKNN